MSTNVVTQSGKSAPNLWISGLLGGVLALTGSLALWVIAMLFDLPLLVAIGPPGQSPLMPLTVVQIIFTVIVSTLAATVIYALLRRFFEQRANRFFQIIALIVLLLSFGAPLSQDVTLVNKVLLAGMHLVTAIAIIWALTLRRSTDA